MDTVVMVAHALMTDFLKFSFGFIGLLLYCYTYGYACFYAYFEIFVYLVG